MSICSICPACCLRCCTQQARISAKLADAGIEVKQEAAAQAGPRTVSSPGKKKHSMVCLCDNCPQRQMHVQPVDTDAAAAKAIAQAMSEMYVLELGWIHRFAWLTL